MPYSVTKLITEAFYTSGIVSRQFETVAGDQFETGLDKLNEILSDTAIEEDMIPYFTSSYSFNAVAGQEKYFIPNLSEPETLTFFLQTVRYQMRKNPRDQYFGQGRADNVLSLPFNWHAERTLGGTNLFVYFFPDTNYPMEITGLFRLNYVTNNQDLTSPLAIADIGIPIISGAGTLLAGQLVINGVDLAGVYPSVAAFVTFLNTPAVPFITGTVSATGQLILSNRSGAGITISTTGNADPLNNVTFANFSTVNGPLSQNFMAIGLDQYYINYLQYRLADRLCSSYNFDFPPGAQRQLLSYMQMISKRSSPIDLSIGKISTLTNKSSINYAQVNLGKGWTI